MFTDKMQILNHSVSTGVQSITATLQTAHVTDKCLSGYNIGEQVWHLVTWVLKLGLGNKWESLRGLSVRQRQVLNPQQLWTILVDW